MTQPKPSEVLTSLSSSLPPETLLHLLSKTFYPALDCLPDAARSNLITILKTIQSDHEELAERIALIDYEGKQRSLQDQVKALNKHVKRDWHDGYEVQAEMMGGIAVDINQWLPTLWAVGVEDGVEISLVHKCLKLCNGTIDSVYACGSRAEFNDFEGEEPIIIEDRTGKVVYSERYKGLYSVIAWLWRELLLSTLVHGQDDNQAKDMINDIDRLGFMNDVEQQLREGTETKTTDGTSFHDEHWSEDMRDAAGQLKKLLAARRIAAFQANPSFNIYRSLILASPGLKGSLLETAREHFFQEKNIKVSWTQALEIFKEAGSADDIVRILDSIHTMFCATPAVAAAERDAVLYLMVQTDNYRLKAHVRLEAGIANAENMLRSEIEGIYPNIDEAYDFLEEKLQANKLTKRERPSKGLLDVDRKRDTILDKFVEIARRGGENSDVEDYEYDQRMGGVDEDDSDYEDVRETLNPDIAGTLRAWFTILDQWPNAAERDALRSKFAGGDHPLYAIDGVADALADRCDFDWKHSSARVHVAEGIRAAYIAFGPDGPVKDRMKSSFERYCSPVRVIWGNTSLSH